MGARFLQTLKVQGSSLPMNPECTSDLKQLTNKGLEKKGLFGYKTSGTLATDPNWITSQEEVARGNAARYDDAVPAHSQQNVGQF